jgi:hypothetical protein
MSTHLKILGSLVGLLLALPIKAMSQDSMQVVILSPRVGAVITPEKANQYNIFQSYDGLQKVIVYRTSTGSFYVGIETLTKAGEVTTKLVPYPYNVLKMMAEKVDHYEEIAAGRYTMGDRPAELRFADSTKIPAAVVPPPTAAAVTPPTTAGVVRRYGWSDILPFAGTKPLRPERTYPLLRFGVCVSSFSSDLNGVQQMENNLVSQFANQGYQINSDPVAGISGPIVWFSIDLLLTSSFGGVLEVGKAGNTAASFRSASLSFRYRLPVDLGKVVCPYVAVGVSQYSADVNQDFSHFERISPVDTNGAYWKLTGVGIHGGDRKYGGMATAGIEIADPMAKALDLEFFVRYLMVPSMAILSPWGESKSLSFTGFTLGARIMICF